MSRKILNFHIYFDITVTAQTQVILKNLTLVIASKAKQSSIRMSTGLLRFARNDGKRDSPQGLF
jgi:hypothetical protein